MEADFPATAPVARTQRLRAFTVTGPAIVVNEPLSLTTRPPRGWSVTLMARFLPGALATATAHAWVRLL